jgi:CRP-like cAMP-binding protein
MADFIEFCAHFSPLDPEAATELFHDLKTKTFRKGEYLLRDQEVCRYLFFINEGLAKSFFYKNDKEFIMRFFGENVLFTPFDSYLGQTPSSFMIRALEKTTVTLISYERMESLCGKYHCMESFMRKLTGVAATKMMRRISGMLEEDAKLRYNRFLEENGALAQRINLGDIARYLGITPPSLSRLRAAR